MSGTRNRTSKKIPTLAAIALMTALTGSVLPAERAAAAPTGKEPLKNGREAKALQNGSKLRRDTSGSSGAASSTSDFAKLTSAAEAFREAHDPWKK